MEKIEFVRKMYVHKNSCFFYVPTGYKKGLRSNIDYKITIEEVEGQN